MPELSKRKQRKQRKKKTYGVETVYRLCSFLPLAGLLTWFLPRIDEGRR